MKTPRRALLSFACVVIAILSIFLFSLFGLLKCPANRISEFKSDLEIMPAFFLFALPGWLIALPFVIVFKDAEGWRGWATLLIGSAIGPGVELALQLIESPHRISQGVPFWQSGFAFSLCASSIISLLTTIGYIATLKCAHRRSALAGQ